MAFQRAQNYGKRWGTEGGTKETVGNGCLNSRMCTAVQRNPCTFHAQWYIFHCFPSLSLSSSPFLMVLGSLERYYDALSDSIL